MVVNGDVLSFSGAGDHVHFTIRSDSDLECGDSLVTSCDEEKICASMLQPKSPPFNGQLMTWIRVEILRISQG